LGRGGEKEISPCVKRWKGHLSLYLIVRGARSEPDRQKGRDCGPILMEGGGEKKDTSSEGKEGKASSILEKKKKGTPGWMGYKS